MSRFVRAAFARAVKERRREIDTDSAAGYGLSLSEYDRRVKRHLRELYRGAELGIRVDECSFPAILLSRRIRSAGDSTPLAEERFDRATRRRVEPLIYTTDHPPVYGYLFDCEGYCAAEADEIAGMPQGIAAFGPIRLVLKRGVRTRATATLGDSLAVTVEGVPTLGLSLEEQLEASTVSGFGNAEVRPAPLTEPDLLACMPDVEPLEWTCVGPLEEIGTHTWAEVQIHGPISLGEIARVDVVGPVADEDNLARLAADAGLCFGRAEGPPRVGPTLRHWFIVQTAVYRCPALRSPIHGRDHWARVADVGLRLADETPGADHRIVWLFSLLHDSQRQNDDADPEHGWRAAEFAAVLADEGMLEPLGTQEVETLLEALALHDAGYVSDDPTVGCCWDADRLDLPRVGIAPDPAFLSTEAAKGRAGQPYRPRMMPLGWQTLYLRVVFAQSKARARVGVRPPSSRILGTPAGDRA